MRAGTLALSLIALVSIAHSPYLEPSHVDPEPVLAETTEEEETSATPAPVTDLLELETDQTPDLDSTAVDLDDAVVVGLDGSSDGDAGSFLDETLAVVTCHGRGCFTSADVLIAMRTLSARAACIMRREMGPSLNPNAIGAAGEIGPIQLHPRGKLPEFLRTGLDPWSPYDTGPWLEDQLRRGQGSHWTTLRYC